MKTVRLYGELGRRFGREYQFDVKTPAEAVRALCTVVHGFEAYMREHGQDQFKVFVGGRNVCEELRNPCSDREIIRIAPVIQGAGAVGRIILGVVLIIIGYVLNFTPFAGASPYLYAAGAGLILGGVIELLSPKQKLLTDTGESANNTPSYNFNGPINTTAQGHPVPLAYGEIRCGSAVISAGLVTQ